MPGSYEQVLGAMVVWCLELGDSLCYIETRKRPGPGQGALDDLANANNAHKNDLGAAWDYAREYEPAKGKRRFP